MDTKRSRTSRFRHKPRWLAILITAISAIALSLSSGVSVAHATTNDPFAAAASDLASLQHEWSAIPEHATAPALDTGRLVNPSGGAESGATVLAFPNPKNVTVGQHLTPVARATTDSDGNYTLHLPYTSWNQLLRSKNDKFANMQVIAFWPHAMASKFTPVSLATRKAATTNLTLRQQPTDGGTGTSAATNAAPTPPPDGAGLCAIQTYRELPAVPVVVGYTSDLLASTEANNYAQYTYKALTSQTTGVGISYTSDNGGFSASGSTTYSAGTDLNFQQMTRPGSYDMVANTTWDDEQLVCSSPTGDPTGFYTEWAAVFNAIDSDGGTPNVADVTANDCTPAAPGSSQTYNYSQQDTWDTGVNIGSEIGIDLSSQDGYTADSSLTYTVGDSETNAAVCGVDGPAGGTGLLGSTAPGYIQVKTNPNS